MQPSSNSSASAAITIAPVDSGRSLLLFFACAVPVFAGVGVEACGVIAAGMLVVGVVAGGVVGVTPAVAVPGVAAVGVVVAAPGATPPDGAYVVVGVEAALVVAAGALSAAGSVEPAPATPAVKRRARRAGDCAAEQRQARQDARVC